MSGARSDAWDLDLAHAGGLGLQGLAGVVAGAQDGVTVIDAQQHFTYANPAAVEMLGYPLTELRDLDFLSCIATRDHAAMMERWSGLLVASPGEPPSPFTCNLIGPDGSEREIVYSSFPLDVKGETHVAVVFEDLTGPRAAGRAAAALAQTVSQLVGSADADEILADVARRAVDGTRAVACGIATVYDGTLTSAGGYGMPSTIDDHARAALRTAFPNISGDDVIAAMTAGAITVGAVPGKPVVLSNARSVWQADPVTRPFVAMVSELDWEAGVYAPLSWQNRVIGVFAIYLQAGLAGPTEAELALYTALADQAAVAHINARLHTQARDSATSLERARVARELHDSVSQELFSMTMHARAAQLALGRAEVDVGGPLARSIDALAGLTRGALAEMRALIFELRPEALAEEGLVAGIRQQAAALNARELATVTVLGSDVRLELDADAEEHLYRITCEALHNVIRHSGADGATVTVHADAHSVWIEVRDDGAGFAPELNRPGHLGLRTMRERAAAIGAELAITSTTGDGTTVRVTLPVNSLGVGTATDGHPDDGSDPLRAPSDRRDADVSQRERANGEPAEGGVSEGPSRMVSTLEREASVGAAGSLGVNALAGILAGAQEGIAVSDASQCFVYTNPALSRMLGRSWEELRGEHFLSVTPKREHDFRLGRFSDLREGAPIRYSGTLIDADGARHEAMYSSFRVQISGIPHTVVFIRDVTAPRSAARAAVALAQAAAQLVGADNTNHILAGIACHAVEGTRAVVCGISAAGDDDRLAEAGGYGPWGSDSGPVRNAGWPGFEDVSQAEVITALTGGSVVVGDAPGRPLVISDVRGVWAASPLLRPLLRTLGDDLPGAAAFLPLAWEGRVFGLFTVCFPPGVTGPSELELAFCGALADQSAVAVINSRLNTRAKQTAVLSERTRLARELHDSVSQALFSMTMHARTAQLAMAKAHLDTAGSLGSSVAQLAASARGAMAEMRALIFELRPAALAEEGLVAALIKQAAALTARDETAITVTGPDPRLNVSPTTEEHLYRIASEALHNVVNHARASTATVSVTEREEGLRVVVEDDGIGFDPNPDRPGHLGLSTMTERAAQIGADIVITSAPGGGTRVVIDLSVTQRHQ